MSGKGMEAVARGLPGLGVGDAAGVMSAGELPIPSWRVM